MATKEDQETLRLLVQHVSRAFYEPKFTIIMDQLARHPVLKDDDLAGRMGLQPKELNKVIAVLSNDSLVKIYRQNELKEGAQRSVGKQYYYIDYEHFCNVVKWRIAKMRHIIDSTLRNELDNKGYICPQCKQSYSPLEVDKLMDFTQGILVCEICHAEVVDNENAESVLGSKDRMQRFNNQMRFIREGLQKSEAMVLPAFDVAAWIKNNPSESDKKNAVAGGPGLKVAGADGSRKEDEGVGVMMAMDKDESTRRLERDAQAEVKRQQNALPSWHLKSTITGDLTALGVKESNREAAAALSMAAGQLANDDSILKGLGVIGGGPSRNQLQGVQNSVVGGVEDVKPSINVESDFYDQYYASLAASSAAASAQPTPTATGLPSSSSNSPDYANGFSHVNEEEDEDKKPNVEYLDSLNAYRKRSRSQEDIGAGGKAKVAKMDNGIVNGYMNGYGGGINGHVNGNGHAVVNGLVNGYENGHGHVVDEAQDAIMESQGESVPGTELDDDPIVMVNGTPKPYSQVTEEDHDLMTPDEYTAYFEIVQERS
ncbi:Transcription initiation factor IIE subunit alpha [Psilocybe cubensis]|uniref:Transcription initiation factor IIE subunit alpha n=1 Tax=Psilocybe cubensis TaxID=181762 RepID=A0ACB8GT58_PSICU|nr:Transcription initiation factor IIE subunit alpha [Psilocybe cubensis]KAH9478542.1 Transcription initiation factor IIE subunit alpha [Psilocybe cubensis]